MEVIMAIRPKTAAEIAEKDGLLSEELLDSAGIACVHAQIENLRCDVYRINERLSWILGSVKAAYCGCKINDGDITDEKVQELIDAIDELDTTALKINDTLIANYTED